MAEAIRAQSQRLGGAAGLLPPRMATVSESRCQTNSWCAHRFYRPIAGHHRVPDSKARVVMNERTGTIVATSRVKVLAGYCPWQYLPAVNKSPEVSTRPNGGGGATTTVPATWQM